MEKELVMVDVDQSSGSFIPFYDEDTSVLYLAGKGDTNIRYAIADLNGTHCGQRANAAHTRPAWRGTDRNESRALARHCGIAQPHRYDTVGSAARSFRYFEIQDDAPYQFFLSQYSGKEPQKGVGMIPKRSCDVRLTAPTLLQVVGHL